MMSIGLLSRHDVANYGSLLQAIATEQIMADLGLKPVTIDYRPKRETSKATAAFHAAGAPLVKRLYWNGPWRLLQHEKKLFFRKNAERYLHLSSEVDECSFSEGVPACDIYCAGSDQIWSRMGDGRLDPNYFFSSLPDSNRFISYASSFGTDCLADSEAARVKKWLNRFSCISVREDSGVTILENLGLRSTQVLDPTLMIGREGWSKFAEKPARDVKKEFVLIYNLYPNRRFYSLVEDMTSDSGLDVISICPTRRRRNGRNLYLPSVGEFIWLFQNASCVITDSFHGTAFSVNFERPFVSVMPGQSATRLESILRLLGLEQRDSRFLEEKPWEMDSRLLHDASRALQRERHASFGWLKRAIEANV